MTLVKKPLLRGKPVIMIFQKLPVKLIPTYFDDEHALQTLIFVSNHCILVSLFAHINLL